MCLGQGVDGGTQKLPEKCSDLTDTRSVLRTPTSCRKNRSGRFVSEGHFGLSITLPLFWRNVPVVKSERRRFVFIYITQFFPNRLTRNQLRDSQMDLVSRYRPRKDLRQVSFDFGGVTKVFLSKRGPTTQILPDSLGLMFKFKRIRYGLGRSNIGRRRFEDLLTNLIPVLQRTVFCLPISEEGEGPFFGHSTLSNLV